MPPSVEQTNYKNRLATVQSSLFGLALYLLYDL